ncbi:ComF family protein [Leucobacter sp. CSA1]|uniref:ComF family protein n=1 Tax=Leucobacter chromiisoli TaxID=2796471 RepID=A0A934Q5G0_9MICO|nr:phosphoribosyltransferase family protein [Leucobacter chromiisoli]MBK0417703.1 ComF family protein [Leucobacter chromiisoli]
MGAEQGAVRGSARGAVRGEAPIRALLHDLAALVWPTCCVACGAPDRDCCAACLAEVRAPVDLLRRELPGPSHGPVAWAAGPYEGPVRSMLVALKHGGRTGFARDLGRRLGAPIAAALELASGGPPPVVVTVPSRPGRVRERGFRHVEVLVDAALRGLRAERPGSRVRRMRALRTLRGRSSQVGLTADERRRNAELVAVRSRLAAALRGREVVLVDDVITTGATVAAARRALERAGARVLAVAALCEVRRSTHPNV